MINYYVNNLDKYESFILEFQEKANTIIRSAKKFKQNFNTDEIPDYQHNKKGYRFKNLYLTEREFECIRYLTYGKTAEEIAIILNISKRTVETHVLNIKSKMNCYNQFRLGFLLGQMNIPI